MPTATLTPGASPARSGTGGPGRGCGHPREEAAPVRQSTDAFEAEVALAAGVVNAADGALVTLAARALREGRWEGDRIHSPGQWLAWQMGVSRHRARTILRVARRAHELPTLMAMLTEGRLSLDQAAVVARYAPAAYEESVCDLARFATVAQIVAATRQYDFDAERPDATDADGGPEDGPGDTPGDGPPAEPAREVSFTSEDGGAWRAQVRLPADEGAVVQAALQAVRDRLHADARTHASAAAEAEGRSPHGTDRDLGVTPATWADALVGMAHATLARGTDGADTTTRVGVLVHLEAPDATSTHPDRWRATLHGHTLPLPPALRRYLTCDADVQVVWRQDGTPVQVGRTRRDIPRRVRRLVEHRDHHRCRVPGCTSRLWLQVHHIVHWEHGGPTDTPNLLLVCARHHRLHHAGHLGIVGNADRPLGSPGAVTFTNGHGLPLVPGRPVPPRAMPSGTYAHPTGERLHRDLVHFTATSPQPPPSREPAHHPAPHHPPPSGGRPPPGD